MLKLDERYPTIHFDPHMPIIEIPWIVENLWQHGKINAVFGPEKSGKSRFLAWVLVNVLLNDSVLGLHIVNKNRPRRILYLAGEEVIPTINSRFVQYAAFAGHKEIGDLPIDFKSVPGLELNKYEQRQELELILKGGHYDTLIIDPLRRVHSGKENDNDEMAVLFNTLRKWSNDLGITIIIIHHTGKLSGDADIDRIANWSRGASDFATLLDTASLLMHGAKRLMLLRQGRFPQQEKIELEDGRDTAFVFKRYVGK